MLNLFTLLLFPFALLGLFDSLVVKVIKYLCNSNKVLKGVFLKLFNSKTRLVFD